MKICKIIASILLFFCTSVIPAQTTGYTDTFDGEMKFTGPGTFTFSQDNGIHHMHIHKEFSKTWQGATYTIGETIDLSTNPIVTIRLKTDTPFILSFYLGDAYLVNQNLNKKIYASDHFVDYTFDFTNVTTVDKTIITRFILTANGNTQDELIAELYIDEIKAGTDATHYADIGAVSKQHVFINSTENAFHVLDIANADSLMISGGETLLENISQSTTGVKTITYDTKGITGSDTISIKAVGATGFTDNIVKATIEIEDNLTPSFNNITNKSVTVSDTITIPITGISDGNTTIEQTLTFSVTSSNQAALPDSNISIAHINGTPTARLTFHTIQAATDIEVTIQADDGFGYNNLYTSSFMIDAYPSINHPPTIDAIENLFVYFENGMHTMTLTGISTGDTSNQTLAFSMTSSNQDVIPDTSIQFSYTQGEQTAELKFTPKNTGSTTLHIKIKDNGGTGFNNGDDSTTVQFTVEVGNIAVTGHVADLTSLARWGINQEGTTQYPELGTFHGKENVLKIEIKDKSCWTATTYRTPELNLDNHRYMCYDIYFEGGDFHLPPPAIGMGQTHCYLYDEGWDANLDRNLPRTHEQREAVYEGEWETVVMDYRGEGGIDNNEGGQINIQRINNLMFNYASGFTWPHPSDDGIVYIANVRIGSAVPDSLLPPIETECTINPVASQVYYENPGMQTISLSGIAGSPNFPVILEAFSSDTSIIPVPTLSDLTADSAKLYFTPKQDTTGRSEIRILVSSQYAIAKSIKFIVDIIEASSFTDIIVERDTLFQEMKGFGTFSFEGRNQYIDYYTEDLGASAMRVGLISNQIEEINDNSDPNVLNLEAFNKSAFDFNFYRRVKEKGVETFILTSWSPPAWMKRNLSVAYAYAAAPYYSATDNILEPYNYEEFAESMVAAVKLFKNEAGVDLYAIGPQNEPAFCEPYASAVLSPEKFTDLIEIIGDRFEQEKISTKLYMPEQVFTQAHYSMAEYISSLKLSEKADQYTDIIATHGYGTSGVQAQNPTYEGWQEMWQQSQNCQFDKELWMTETYPEYSNWSSAISLAGAIHGALVYGNVSLWTLWNIEGTLIEEHQPTASFYTSKNYYKYIRPGARRILVTENHDDILASAFIHPITKQQTVVLINKGTKPVNINLYGTLHPDYYDAYTTANHVNFEYRGRVERDEQIALPASSVTTLVGTIEGDVIAVGIEDIATPKGFKLYQNYPNPFNPETVIQFQIPNAAETTITIYNVLGQKVQTLVNNTLAAGQHQIIWNGKNQYGQQVSTGVYIYQIKSGKHIDSKKCLLIK